MAKKHGELEDKQRTIEWFASRMGHITGSQRIDTYMSNLGNPHALNRLLDDLDEEINLSEQQVSDKFEQEQADANEYMRWGSAHELEAARTYQMINNVDITYSPGFKEHPEFPCFGVSLDLIDTTNNWTGEIKCPGKEGNHAKAVRYGMAKWHVNQTQLQLECSPEQIMLIFISFDPRHPVKKDVLYQQLQRRNDDWIGKFRSKAGEFDDHLRAGTRFKHDVIQQAEGVPQLF